MCRLKKILLVKVTALLVLFVTACTDSANQAADQTDAASTVEQPLASFKTERLDLTAKDVAAVIDENPDFIVLDIRTAKEYAEGHIENALNLDFYMDNFRTRLAALDREQTYIVHCRSGGRSGKAVPMMEDLGFKKVVHLAGGIKDWEASNLPVITD